VTLRPIPPPTLQLHGLLREPELSFHPEREQNRSPHPLRGLLEFGPYSSGLLNRAPDPIRLATITPAGEQKRIGGFIAELGQKHDPRERRDYLPPFPGFRMVFKVNIVQAEGVQLELSPGAEEAVHSAAPHRAIADEIVRAITRLEAHRGSFDVLLVYLPARWSPAFVGPSGDEFDLHDYLKAVTAMRGIPLQIVREDKALAYFCRASVMWRQGIALYAKAGGVPWKLAATDPGVAYIGLSYAVRAHVGERPRFYTCCSQVFEADGAGLEFLLYETDDVVVERENPFLSRKEMRNVMSRSLALYQKRHPGDSPRRLVVHKTTPFRPEEVDGVFDAFPKTQEIELVQVKQDHAWRGIQIGAPRPGQNKGAPTPFPVQRGTYLQTGGREVLLWVQGNAPTAVGGRNYFKEAKGIPAPLELVRWAGHGGWEEGCRAVLALSKMNWNNDALYDSLPVTMGYARVLAQVVSRLTELAPNPYQLRFFM
jgi:hypothetical protein